MALHKLGFIMALYKLGFKMD